MRRKLVLILALGHLCTDLNQGALPALLPYFIALHHFSYAAAAGLVFAPNLVSSVFQPLFGWLADRFPVSWFVPVGIIAAGIGIEATSLMPSYKLMMAACALSGLGLASFHPESARLVSYVSAEKKATAMSLFTVGGNAGFAVGPILTVLCITWVGLRGMYLLLLPGLVVVAIYYLNRREFRRADPADKQGAPNSKRVQEKDAWVPFLYLTGASVCRSIVFFGMNTFLALYWIDHLHQTKEAGNTVLSLFIFVGAAGSVAGGTLADRFGRFRVVLISLVMAPFLLLAFLQIHQPVFAMFVLAPLAVALFASFSVMIVLGQQFLPNHRGVASGIMLGAAGSIGGVATPIFGRIADRHGMHAALAALEVAACLAIVTAVAAHRYARMHERRLLAIA
ncbi:MAG: MFS transporter [Candidatus Acidiferrales bacterium]|jgi:FSR family fosmidomycin resistance protein-like MFS transporter